MGVGRSEAEGRIKEDLWLSAVSSSNWSRSLALRKVEREMRG